ncbi:hypothetical protein CSUI_006243, partial [Cystoisospora suis]
DLSLERMKKKKQKRRREGRDTPHDFLRLFLAFFFFFSSVGLHLLFFFMRA